MDSQILKIQLQHLQTLEGVPSASGIVKLKEDFYVVGDDAPFLFHIDNQFNFISKRPIYSSEKLKGETIPKIDKPDFEAMEMVSATEILVFGSGSKSPERNICVLAEIKRDTVIYQHYSIDKFYNYLRNLDIMQGFELNIEALACYKDNCYLFNRGRNAVFTFPLAAFLEYCKTGTNFPQPSATLIALPKIRGLQAGFSGATSFKNRPYLIFTAAVEDTPNAYDDGTILGSFIGVIEIKDHGLSQDILIQPIQYAAPALKIESVIIDNEVSNTEVDLVLVTDNDGLASQIIRMRMTLEADNH